jgi:AraC-like DNA-binding protein
VSGFSMPYLSAVFKKEVGQTISAYILGLKIKTAQEMLLNSRRTSKNIAFLLNFSSQSYFIHCFKRVTGFTPRQFRQNNGCTELKGQG